MSILEDRPRGFLGKLGTGMSALGQAIPELLKDYQQQKIASEQRKARQSFIDQQAEKDPLFASFLASAPDLKSGIDNYKSFREAQSYGPMDQGTNDYDYEGGGGSNFQQSILPQQQGRISPQQMQQIQYQRQAQGLMGGSMEEFENLYAPTQEQTAATQQLMQGLPQQQMGAAAGPPQGAPLGGGIQPGQEMSQQAPQQPKSMVEIAGIPTDRSALPKSERELPYAAKGATAQQSALRRNDAKIKEFTKDNGSVSKDRETYENSQRIKELIDDPEIGLSAVGKALLAYGDWMGVEAFEKFGTNAKQQELLSLVFRQVHPKEFGGSNPATKEIQMQLRQFPHLLNTKEGNRMIADRLGEEALTKYKKSEIIRDVKKRVKNPNADQFQSFVEGAVERYKNTPLLERQVPKGSWAGPGVAEAFLEAANGDKNLAYKMMKEKGYGR